MATRLIAEKGARLVAAANATENVEQLEAIERDLGALVAKLKIAHCKMQIANRKDRHLTPALSPSEAEREKKGGAL